MYTIYKLTIASIKMFLRSRQALFFSLFMPFIIMVIFGSLGFDKPPKIDVGLVTHNTNTETKAFLEQIKKFPSFTIHEGTLDEERLALDKGDRSAILDVPDDFLSTKPNASVKTVTVYENAGQIGQAQTVVSILNQYTNRLTLEAVKAPTLFHVDERPINSHNLRYIEFLLPGLIALSIMQMSVFSVAFVFTQYKEKGILKRLLATPMQPYQFVTANIITRLTVSLLQTAIFITMGVLLFKAHIVGSYVLLAFCVLLGAIMFLGLGFSISGVSKTVDSVPAIGNLVVFPMIFLGGAFFSISSMPAWLQHIARLLPLTFFSTALRDIMTKGSGIADIKWNLLGMIVWGIILIIVATYSFRFQEKESA